MGKTDLKVDYRDLYTAPVGEIVEVEVPDLAYLMIDGQGDPNTSSGYVECVNALFSVAYKTKFACRSDTGEDFVVMPLEGLWWVDDMEAFSIDDKEDWNWVMMIVQPDAVTATHVDIAITDVTERKGLEAAGRIRFERWAEGRCMQTLHKGSYAEEAPTIDRLHAHIVEQGLTRIGRHHEIYLNTPERTSQEKLRTIIRQPVIA